MAWYLWILAAIVTWIAAAIGERISRLFARRSEQYKNVVTFWVVVSFLSGIEVAIVANVLYGRNVAIIFLSGTVTSLLQGLILGIALWRGWGQRLARRLGYWFARSDGSKHQ